MLTLKILSEDIAGAPAVYPADLAPGAARYELPIDLNSQSTHGRVVRLVGENKRVLELGCATGYMSRVLRQRGCQVVGIEIDAAAAVVAAAECERVIVGDLEQLDLAQELGDDRFDVVVAADVLEHLREPGQLLAALRPFFRPGGYLVASLPNIAHGSVRLALLEGRFPYSETGLLDRTHLRFYTLESMITLFETAGYSLDHLERKEQAIETTEIPYHHTALSDALVETLTDDPEARTYQFIVTASPTPPIPLAAPPQPTAAYVKAKRPKHGALVEIPQTEAITALYVQTARLRDDLEAREQGLIDQQHNFSRQIDQRDQIIRELQVELHLKVGERDQIIRDLQAELHQKVGERDQIIRDLQAELYQKIDERDQIICELQAALRNDVP